MAQGSFNLQAIWRALGKRSLDQWEIENRVIPTISVADFSKLTPQYDPPSAGFGALTVAVALEFGVVQVFSRAPGGCRLKFMQWAVALGYGWEIRPAPTAFNNVVISIPQVMSREAPLSSVTSGSILAALNTAQVPQGTIAGTPMQFLEIWLPPGSCFFAEANVINTQGGFQLYVSDVPVAEGTD